VIWCDENLVEKYDKWISDSYHFTTVERWRTARRWRSSQLLQGNLLGLVSVGACSPWPASACRSVARTGFRHGRSRKTNFATSAFGTSASRTTCISRTIARKCTTAVGGYLTHSRNTTNFASGSFLVSVFLWYNTELNRYWYWYRIRDSIWKYCDHWLCQQFLTTVHYVCFIATEIKFNCLTLFSLFHFMIFATNIWCHNK